MVKKHPQTFGNSLAHPIGQQSRKYHCLCVVAEKRRKSFRNEPVGRGCFFVVEQVNRENLLWQGNYIHRRGREDKRMEMDLWCHLGSPQIVGRSFLGTRAWIMNAKQINVVPLPAEQQWQQQQQRNRTNVKVDGPKGCGGGLHFWELGF